MAEQQKEKQTGIVTTATAPIITMMAVKKMMVDLMVVQGQVQLLLITALPEKVEQINKGAKEAREIATKAVNDLFDSWHKDIDQQIH